MWNVSPALPSHNFFTILLPLPDTSQSLSRQCFIMKTSSLIACAIFVAGSVFRVSSAERSSSLDAFALNAIDPSQTYAIEELRAAGPAGLDAMFRVYGDRIQKQMTSA